MRRMGVAVPSENKGGDCYRAAGTYIVDNAFGKNGDKSLVLVHGEVTGQGPIEGVKYGHAWVEKGGMVIDKSNDRDIKMPKALYYALGNIKKTVRYTSEEVLDKITTTEHWGPWD